jgi:hypothetical protein
MKDAKARLRRKKVYSVFDIGRLPVTDEKGNVVAVDVAPSPKSSRELLQREQEQEHQRQLAAQRERDTAAKAYHDNRVREYWSQSISLLKSRAVGVNDMFSRMQTSASESDAGQRFIAELSAANITLSSDGRNRLALYCESQNTHSHGQYGVTATNLRQALSRLKSLGCFADGEVHEPKPEPAREAAPLSQDDVLRTMDTRTREGNAALRQATELAWLNETRPIVEMWVGHLLSDYNYEPSPDQFRYMFNPIDGLIVKHGLAVTADSLNKVRRIMVAEGRFPSHMLSCAEIIDQKYRKGEMTFAEYNREFQRLSREDKWNRPRATAGL